MKIAIVGASGFIGSYLTRELSEKTDHQIVGLSRSREGTSQDEEGRVVEWRRCDLFSLLDIENALEGVDQAFYLVHSMSPSAGLVQGSFDELDLLLADNFIRAAKRCGLKHIIYLGGLLPTGDPNGWSSHLRSRYEVEEIFINSKIATTIFRAGMIVGPEGSSFEMLQRLVQRLPVMICPQWTKAKSSVVTRELISCYLRWAISRDCSEQKVSIYDIGESEVLSYQQMMLEMGEVLGRKPLLISIPFFSPKLSRLWVSLVTGAPRNLVYPLVMSLKHSLIPRENTLPREALQECRPKKVPFIDLIRDFCPSEKEGKSKGILPHAFKKTFSRSKTVRSVQRIELIRDLDAEFIARQYLFWLPNFMYPIIKVRLSGNTAGFYFIGLKYPLLRLVRSEKRSYQFRQLFYIKGGLLAKKGGRGRLEFRVIDSPHVLISAIHDFKPAIPWLVYKYTQALVHLFVMKRFGRYINKG